MAKQTITDGSNSSCSPTPSAIRAARESASLTQKQAAGLIHCALRSWAQWEAGDRKMHPAFWELFQIKSSP
ncbi:helix-turn-helix domain-containing protein [Acetobacter tropicalis]|uniref:helix-turn-helix domain-containing protein n=1 Tax=Acetobacter tropicalis TaxID=104102 RepID=UPI003974F18C